MWWGQETACATDPNHVFWALSFFQSVNPSFYLSAYQSFNYFWTTVIHKPLTLRSVLKPFTQSKRNQLIPPEHEATVAGKTGGKPSALLDQGGKEFKKRLSQWELNKEWLFNKYHTKLWLIMLLFFCFFSCGKWEINTNKIDLYTDCLESDEPVHKYRTVCVWVCHKSMANPQTIFILLEVFSLTQSTVWVEPVPRWQTDCRSINVPGRLQAPVRDISGLQLMCARGAKVTTLSATDYKAWCNGIKIQIL